MDRWLLGVIANGVISVAYLAIAWSMTRRVLLVDRQWRTNQLAVATASIFLSCGIGHGLHGAHALVGPEVSSARQLLGDSHLLLADGLTAGVATWYWTLRRLFPALSSSGAQRHQFYEDSRAKGVRLLAEAADALEGSLVLMVRRDGHWVVRLANGEARALLGLGAEDVDRGLDELLPPEAVQVLLASADAVGESTTTVRVEVLQAPAPLPASCAVTTKVWEGGLLVLWTDIASQVTSRTAAQGLALELQTAFTSAPNGMAMAGPDGVLRQANEPLCELLGHPVQWLVGRHLTDLCVPTDRPVLRAALAGLSQRGEDVDLEVLLEQADAEPRWARVSAAGVRSPDGVVRRLVVHVADIGQRKGYEARLRVLADSDPLTGLANRRAFTDQLRQHVAWVARYGGRGALLVIDLDGFKAVNDTQGHAAGDEVLVGVAALLRAGVRSSDLVARLGGDEFAVLLTHDGGPVVDTAQRLVDAIRGSSAAVSASIGVAWFDRPGATADEILGEADLALYDAKDAGRDRVGLSPRADVTAVRLT